ncbi:hypothetical protein RHMOL_Rhmol09G0121700 [Rhododendron molle]|uniref:Uncharacterized protein n=1 Tax=Rhododendron molle TaxID=49168 RepID=A0ACC0MDL1_RHOML|nr:hypothetical protein RHMOL_Rhmol09G0121700 [Rhododendron molle]
MDVVDWYVQNVQNKGFSNLLLKSMLAATVYGLWMERNVRIFQDRASSTVDIVSLKIVNSIRDFLQEESRLRLPVCI